jgi:hypothetical protein
MANNEVTEREIGNYYEPYRRSQRERALAIDAVARHKEEQKMFERLADEGEAIKIVTYDKAMRLTRTHYERIYPKQ